MANIQPQDDRAKLLTLLAVAQTTVDPENVQDGSTHDEFVRGLCAVVIRATRILNDDDGETIRRLITGVRD